MKVDSDPAVRSLCLFTPAFSAEEVAALVVDNSGTAGFAGYDAPRAMLARWCSSLVGRPTYSAVCAQTVEIPQVQFLVS